MTTATKIAILLLFWFSLWRLLRRVIALVAAIRSRRRRAALLAAADEITAQPDPLPRAATFELEAIDDELKIIEYQSARTAEPERLLKLAAKADRLQARRTKIAEKYGISDN